MKTIRAFAFPLSLAAVAAITVLIAVAGGLPAQLAHLYYLPVPVSALLLPRSQSFLIAIASALAVSPAIDVANRALGLEPYFSGLAFADFGPSGWVMRPLALVASRSCCKNKTV